MKKRGKNKLNKKSQIIQPSEIRLLLNSYDDIFSIFDPRPYSQKALSEDFLSEAKKASRDKKDGIQLNLLIPVKKRKKHEEEIIRKRLKEHFSKHFDLLKKDVKNIVLKQGLSFIISGIIIMFIASVLLFFYKEQTFFITFLIIFLEPAGWFLFWEGLGLVIFESKKVKPNLEFYEKMSKCKISFLSC